MEKCNALFHRNCRPSTGQAPELSRVGKIIPLMLQIKVVNGAQMFACRIHPVLLLGSC